MQLVVSELLTTLSQDIVASSNLNIEAIRPRLLKYGSPAGSLFLRVKDSGGKLIKQSETISIASISAADYFHGLVRFYIDLGLREGTTYIVELGSTGYTYNSSHWVGWIFDYDMRVVDGPSGAVYQLELWERKTVTRG